MGTNGLQYGGLKLKYDVHENSIKAYKYIIESGILSKARLKVYTALSELGQANATEIAIHLNYKNTTGSNIRARLGELVGMDCVDIVGSYKCPISKQTVKTYRVNGRMPKPLTKKKTKIELAYEQGYKDGKNDAIKETNAQLNLTYSTNNQSQADSGKRSPN